MRKKTCRDRCADLGGCHDAGDECPNYKGDCSACRAERDAVCCRELVTPEETPALPEHWKMVMDNRGTIISSEGAYIFTGYRDRYLRGGDIQDFMHFIRGEKELFGRSENFGKVISFTVLFRKCCGKIIKMDFMAEPVLCKRSKSLVGFDCNMLRVHSGNPTDYKKREFG